MASSHAPHISRANSHPETHQPVARALDYLHVTANIEHNGGASAAPQVINSQWGAQSCLDKSKSAWSRNFTPSQQMANISSNKHTQV